MVDGQGSRGVQDRPRTEVSSAVIMKGGCSFMTSGLDCLSLDVEGHRDNGEKCQC